MPGKEPSTGCMLAAAGRRGDASGESSHWRCCKVGVPAGTTAGGPLWQALTGSACVLTLLCVLLTLWVRCTCRAVCKQPNDRSAPAPAVVSPVWQV